MPGKGEKAIIIFMLISEGQIRRHLGRFMNHLKIMDTPQLAEGVIH